MLFATIVPFALAAFSIAVPSVIAAPQYNFGNDLYIRDEQVEILARMLEPAIQEYIYRRTPVFGFGSKDKGKGKAPAINHPDGDVRNQLSFVDASHGAIGHKEVAAQQAQKQAQKDAKAAKSANSGWGKMKAAVKSGFGKAGSTAVKTKNTVIPPKPIYDPKAPPAVGYHAVQQQDARLTDKQKKKIAKAPAYRASTGQWE